MKLRRYKFTILVIIMMALAAGCLVYRATDKIRCDNRGGVYVQTFGGYKCVGEK